jgi:uncharacterized protein YdeI (YjbR/CyaY-like superfamily)
MNDKIETYFSDGCGRCPRGGTPECSVNKWREELTKLRAVILSCPLKEEVKWGSPCYTFQNSNVLLLGSFKDYCALSFLNGALLKDSHGILKKPGENTQAGRVVRFTQVQEVIALEPVLKAYIEEAIELEKAGAKVELKAKDLLVYPEELQRKLDEIPALKAAFAALTPGKQRGYILHFSAPKQSQTRESRVEKCMQQILDGKGFHDDYRLKR